MNNYYLREYGTTSYILEMYVHENSFKVLRKDDVMKTADAKFLIVDQDEAEVSLIIIQLNKIGLFILKYREFKSKLRNLKRKYLPLL